MFAALDERTKARLHQIGAEHRTEFGTSRRIQTTFDRHVDYFDELIARGADHQIIGELLAVVGITRRDGSPLPLGTISGALSRARERAVARAQQPTTSLQCTAAECSSLQDTAGARSDVPAPNAQPDSLPATDGRYGPVLQPEASLHAAHDAARILNRLRGEEL